MDAIIFIIADYVMHNICSGMSGYVDEEEHYFNSLSRTHTYANALHALTHTHTHTFMLTPEHNNTQSHYYKDAKHC